MQLDGKDCRLESTSGNAQQYLVTPENTEGLDENEHTLYVYAEDEYGNYGEKTVKFRGVRAEPGTKIGTATFYVDLTVLGLDTSRTIEVDVLAGEPISYTIAKAVWNEDTGEPFGKAAAKQTLNWPAAVSYTHLDVYKRQELGSTVTVDRSVVGDEMTFNGFTADGVTVNAVTHEVTVTGLTTGRHIIKVEKGGAANYQVVTTRAVSYDLQDSTGAAITDPSTVKAGDTVKLQFHNLVNPKEKLSGVYNFNASLYYTGEDGTSFRSIPGGN